MTDARPTFTPHPYALMLPPLTDDEYAALKAHVARHGILHPVITDEHGLVLDGVHRTLIAAELGIDAPVSQMGQASEQDKLHLALGINVRRRHLDADRRRELVRKLSDERGFTVRKIAEITGWSKSTVARDLGPPAPPKPTQAPAEAWSWADSEARIAAAERETIERKRAELPDSEHLARAAGALARIEAHDRELRSFGAWLLAEGEREDDEQCRRIASLFIRLGSLDPWEPTRCGIGATAGRPRRCPRWDTRRGRALMPSVWLSTYAAKDGSKRYRVRYRLGGSETKALYGGSFPRRRDALARKSWIAGELAARRMPDLRPLAESTEPQRAPTFADAAERWRTSRVDVSEGTRTQQRTSLNRALRILGERRLDELSAHDVAAMVGELHAEGLKPSFIRKIVQATAMVLDHAGLSPNPARDKVIVRLPRDEPDEINPPSAEHVEAVYRLLPSKHRLALLWLDWSGARVSSIDSTLVGDYDESRRRVRLRAATTKTRRALWVELHPVLADRLEATLGPREDRNPEARLFPDSGADSLRTAIVKACKAAAVPTFSPHDLRHRRISLMHLRGVPWARIGEFVGQRNLAVTANTYSHVLVDEAEVEYAALP